MRALRFLALVLTLASVGGCSLVGKSAKPDPAVEDHVKCLLDYRPDDPSADGTDLIFAAWSSPYQEEAFAMSAPDVALHSLFAPGRHLSADLELEGVDCSRPLWKKGFRLPHSPDPKKLLRCRRRGTQAVSFRAETKWGPCELEIPAGDLAPRPHPWAAQWAFSRAATED